ncbi:MAG TPA: 3'(2'),5'-bisphosphate nucleotidase [Porticoccaceae bacterium]|nr:3'(2'),5'-bisphosphate nucleotidase [Porticoccaceae bacterium]
MEYDLDPKLLERVIALAIDAGEAILRIYDGGDFDVEKKQDDSPLTAADLAAHKVLEAGLEPMLSGVPLLSEESVVPDFATRQSWQRYWIIDPLDGTKEFINRNGEFTVNIALIDGGVPVLGVVHVPVTGITYAGVRQQGAFKLDGRGEKTAIRSRSMEGRGQVDKPVEVVASRRHGAGAVDTLLAGLSDSLGSVETCNMGSSLKLCLVAEGEADIYPRLAPTMEWDTAAAQAVVEAAGGLVLDTQFEVVRYNTKDDLLNPFFYVVGDPDFAWRDLIGRM